METVGTAQVSIGNVSDGVCGFDLACAAIGGLADSLRMPFEMSDEKPSSFERGSWHFRCGGKAPRWKSEDQ